MNAQISAGWTRAQRHLHWWTALLVLLAVAIAWAMVNLPRTQLLLKFALYQVHKTIGLLVLALVVARIGVRLTRGRPGWDADLPAWQERAASAMHALLYALLLLTPVLGYLTACTAPANVPTLFLGVIRVPHILGRDPSLFAYLRPMHLSAALCLVALACAHAAAAIHNHFRGRATLRRMWAGGSPPARNEARYPRSSASPPLRPDG